MKVVKGGVGGRGDENIRIRVLERVGKILTDCDDFLQSATND